AEARFISYDSLEDQVSAAGAREGLSNLDLEARSIIQTAQQTLSNASDATREFVSSVFARGQPCNTKNGMVGVCVFKKQCNSAVSGIHDEGTCGTAGYVCCVSLISCGHRTSSGLSYFINPEYPKGSKASRMCEAIIMKTHQEICQFRVTFETFELAGPTKGECLNDAFSVSGHNRNFEIPHICGQNTNQHIIVPVDQASCGTRFTFITTGSYQARRWRLKITQIKCGHDFQAPNGCLKYYLTPSGTMKSFNFDSDNKHEGYFNNLNYAMCIKRANNFCGITLSSFDFHVSNLYPNCSSDNCRNTDFIQVPPSKKVTPARLCGEKFNPVAGMHSNAPLRLEMTTPFVFYFKSTGEGPKPKGFAIDYQQNLCR
ncbi:uncharacterized protein B4U79_07550, partial [Dinothrombium tinctorium]